MYLWMLKDTTITFACSLLYPYDTRIQQGGERSEPTCLYFHKMTRKKSKKKLCRVLNPLVQNHMWAPRVETDPSTTMFVKIFMLGGGGIKKFLLVSIATVSLLISNWSTKVKLCTWLMVVNVSKQCSTKVRNEVYCKLSMIQC